MNLNHELKNILHEINQTSDEQLSSDDQLLKFASPFGDILLEDNIIVICDSDADGLCSGRIWMEYMANQTGEIIPLDRSNRDPLSIASRHVDNGIIVCLDCGSGADWSTVKNKVYVIDHHESNVRYDNVTYINPVMTDGYTTYCTSTLLYSLVSHFLGYNDVAIQYAAIGGVADMTPMLGGNRNVVRLGLEEMNARPCDIAKEFPPYKVDYDEMHIGFSIAPAINAPSRIGTPDVAYRAVVLGETAAIVGLKTANNRRKYLAKKILESAEIVKHNSCTVVKIVAEGMAITGLIANKLLSSEKRPVLCINSDNSASMRSYSVDVEKFIKSNEDVITGGGHKYAAGALIAQNAVDEVIERFVQYCNHESYADNEVNLYDMFLDTANIDKIKSALMGFKPFGQKFRIPIFGTYFKIKWIKDKDTQSVSEGYASMMLEHGSRTHFAKCFSVPFLLQVGCEYFMTFEINLDSLNILGVENE